MIAYNVSQITYLWCKLHKVKKVYFVGNFVHAQEYTMDRLTNAFDFWARQEMKLIYNSYFYQNLPSQQFLIRRL